LPKVRLVTPDDDLIDTIEALALTAVGVVVATVLGADLVVRALRRKAGR
jgi:hypothetical protein